ncbi:CS domain-containing protein [Methyloligella halotolerans]|uniref:CS domain-containing protein n=1 Tax=Methyloligella halotolerans TaxID=1177755 RepID=UPI003CC97411
MLTRCAKRRNEWRQPSTKVEIEMTFKNSKLRARRLEISTKPPSTKVGANREQGELTH